MEKFEEKSEAPEAEEAEKKEPTKELPKKEEFAAKVPFAIPRHMKQALLDLGYNKKDLGQMKPEEAHRLFQEGKVKQRNLNIKN